MGKGTLELNEVIGALLSLVKMKRDGDDSQAYGLVFLIGMILRHMDLL